MRSTLLLLVSCFLSPAVFAGEAPAITAVSPPGVQLGTSVEVKLNGKPGDGPLQVWMSCTGLTWEISEKGDSAQVTASEQAPPGRHWIRFHNQFGATELRPFFVGVIPEAVETEPNNTLAEAQVLMQPSVLINGVLDKAGEVDVWAVDVPANRTLVAAMQANSQLGSPMDGVLQILDANGTVIAQNDDDHGFDPLVTWTPKDAGRFFLRTFAFPSQPNSTVRLAGAATYVYRLTITTEAYVDHVSPLAVNRSAPELVAVHGWNISEELKSIPPVRSDDRATVFQGLANAHRLTRSELTPIVESDSVTAIPLGHSLTGRIAQNKEKDTFQLPGGKGQKLKLAVACRSVDSLLDPVLIVRAADGRVLKEVDDRSRSDLDCEAVVTLPEEGCTVEISDRYLKGGSRFYYLLTVTEPAPSLKPTVAATKFAVTADKPLEIPVTIGRQNGFAEKVTVEVTGLPGSLVCPPVESPNEGDAAKTVTLQLSVAGAGIPAWSGAVQIRCVSESGEFAAEATIPSYSATTSTIWLSHPEIAAAAEKPEGEADSESKTEKPNE